MQFDKIKFATILLVIIHIVGILGLTFPFWRPYFLFLTPFNLLLSAIILFYFHRDWSPAFFLFGGIAFVVGFSVEVVGVASGVIFGSYAYSDVLGPKLLGTPLIIGLNWLMLIYLTGSLLNMIPSTDLIKAGMASFLMVIMDLAIEPVAIKLNFWNWENDIVPLQNYVAWYFISFFLLWVFYRLPFSKFNPIAYRLFLIQLSFFVVLSFTLKLAWD